MGAFRGPGASVKLHGFLRTATGAFTTIDVPGAYATDALGINNAGQVVGSYSDAGRDHGFVRSAAGAFTTIDVPGEYGTEAYGINDAGQIVGNFKDASGHDHGFLRTATGAITTIGP